MCNDTDWTFRSVLHAEARGYSTIQRRKLDPPSRLAENRPSLGNIEELTSWILTVPFLYFFCCSPFEFSSEPFQFKSGSFWRVFLFYRIFIPVGYTNYFLTYSTTAVLHSPSYLHMSPWLNFCRMFHLKHRPIPIYQICTSYC